MCDLTENGWQDHKELVYDKIDATNECLEGLAATQDTILETIRKTDSQILEKMHAREVQSLAADTERVRFEATVKEKMINQEKSISRIEKLIFGAFFTVGAQIALNLLGVT